jgi:tryptophan halogenase
MTRPVDVVIVGGGTAGWMSAAALAGLLGPTICRVRLIESDEIGTVGVGEATLPHMRRFNDALGILEPDMMRRTQASFKLGVEFVDWGFEGASYIHPFGAFGRPIGGVAFQHQWVRARQQGIESPIESFSLAVEAARANRFDFPDPDPTSVGATYDYAYHLDASLYARLLRTYSEARGVLRTEGKLVEVERHPERGDIASVRLRSGEQIAGDFFIDCSGFRSLLLGETLRAPFEDWSQWLPCDSAYAVPTTRAGPFTPYTRSTAREAGWQWRIPLQHRVGNGHVFASAFTAPERALELLLANLESAPLSEPRLLRFRAGRRTDSWVGNCMAVGLASGFLEPLESTSIYLIQTAVMNFVRLFPQAEVDPALAREFNRLTNVEYDRIRDFLILHYHLNRREDSDLWRYCRAMEVPDSLKERMELFAHRGFIEEYKDGLFSPPSWLSVYLGQGLAPRAYHPMADAMPLPALAAELGSLRANVHEAVNALPSHEQAIEDYCEAAPAGATA